MEVKLSSHPLLWNEKKKLEFLLRSCDRVSDQKSEDEKQINSIIEFESVD
jgi:hypothetical protein